MSRIALCYRLNHQVTDENRETWWELELLPLGTKTDIIKLIGTWFPKADYHELSRSDDLDIWVSVHPNNDITEIMPSFISSTPDEQLIRGIGFRNPSTRLLRDICHKMGWVAYVASYGELMNFDNLPSDYFHNSNPWSSKTRIAHTILVNQIVQIRSDLLKVITTDKIEDFAALQTTISELRNGIKTENESNYWVVLDDMLYVANYPALTDRAIYIPTEAQIRAINTE